MVTPSLLESVRTALQSKNVTCSTEEMTQLLGELGIKVNTDTVEHPSYNRHLKVVCKCCGSVTYETYLMEWDDSCRVYRSTVKTVSTEYDEKETYDQPSIVETCRHCFDKYMEKDKRELVVELLKLRRRM